jgi:hypothetical protein
MSDEKCTSSSATEGEEISVCDIGGIGTGMFRPWGTNLTADDRFGY